MASGMSTVAAALLSLPPSSTSSSVISSAFCSSSRAKRYMMRPRSSALMVRHGACRSKARRAAPTAASTSACPATAATAIWRPVPGSITSMVRPDRGSTISPSMKSCGAAERNRAVSSLMPDGMRMPEVAVIAWVSLSLAGPVTLVRAPLLEVASGVVQRRECFPRESGRRVPERERAVRRRRSFFEVEGAAEGHLDAVAEGRASVVAHDDAIVFARLFGRGVCQLVRTVRVERGDPDRLHIEGVVQGDQSHVMSEGVDEYSVLRMNVHHRVDIGPRLIGPLMQLPLTGRVQASTDDLARQRDHGEVFRGESVEPGSSAGDHERIASGQPRREVAPAGEGEAALDSIAPHHHQFVNERERIVGQGHFFSLILSGRSMRSGLNFAPRLDTRNATTRATRSTIPRRAAFVLKSSPSRSSPLLSMVRKSTPTRVPATLGRERGCMEAPMKTAAIPSSRYENPAIGVKMRSPELIRMPATAAMTPEKM